MDGDYNRRKETEKFCEILKILKDEYDGLAVSNHTKLVLLDLKVDNLPKDLFNSSEMCAKLSQALGLEDINKCTLMAKNTDMLFKRHRDRENLFQAKINGIKINRLLRDLQGQTKLIKRMCESSLDDNEVMGELNRKKISEVAFLEEKLKCYHEQVKKLDETIAEIEPKFELKHVIDCDAQIKSMDAEISDLQSKLDRYRNLPPNMILAKDKVKEEKLKLERCEEELTNYIENYVETFK